MSCRRLALGQEVGRGSPVCGLTLTNEQMCVFVVFVVLQCLWASVKSSAAATLLQGFLLFSQCSWVAGADGSWTDGGNVGTNCLEGVSAVSVGGSGGVLGGPVEMKPDWSTFIDSAQLLPTFLPTLYLSFLPFVKPFTADVFPFWPHWVVVFSSSWQQPLSRTKTDENI